MSTESSEQFDEQAIVGAPLIDLEHWERMTNELGDSMLAEFAREFFEETEEVWFTPSKSPFELEERAFRSFSHRTAGAAGTLGFRRLRVCLLAMEHAPSRDSSKVLLDPLRQCLTDTKSWVERHFG